MQQHTLQQHNSGRFAVAPKLLVGQQGGAGPMMAGRMMPGVGGMAGQSLTSGLEDLKKTAGAVRASGRSTAQQHARLHRWSCLPWGRC